MVDRQAVFDRVRDHLLRQKRRSLRAILGEQFCAYRDENGLKCAIGCLITDQAYRPSIEGNNPKDARVKNALRASGIEIDGEADLLFLGRLQSIHDSEEPEDWAAELKSFAHLYDLNYEGTP